MAKKKVVTKKPVVKSLNKVTKDPEPVRMVSLDLEAEKLYLSRRRLAAKRSKLDKQSKELKEQIAKLDRDMLALAKIEGDCDAKLSNGKIVHVKLVEVEGRMQEVAPYSFYKFSEE